MGATPGDLAAGSGLYRETLLSRAVAHDPFGSPVNHEKWQILMVRGTHPTLAGTEARPTNLKLETRNFSRQAIKRLSQVMDQARTALMAAHFRSEVMRLKALSAVLNKA